MAFITHALPLRSARRAAPAVCMEAEVSAAPLNADKKYAMKETFPVTTKKAPLCRCWQSGKFPLCNGSHNAYNKATGSNVGPIVVDPQPQE